MGTRLKPTADDDTVLVNSWRKGDISSFETLVRKYQKRLFNIAYRITGDYDEACEVVEETFVTAYRGGDSFRGGSRVSTRLMGITITLLRDRVRQAQTKSQHEYHPPEAAVTADGRSRGHGAETAPLSSLERLDRRDVLEKVQECIASLSPDFRETIVLRDLQGLPYHEIGEILDVLEGTVKARLYRAREMVKDCLKLAIGEL